MPLEIKCSCIKCGKPQTVTVAAARKEQITCLACGAAMLETRDISGYLYILSNPSMPGLVKIGITTRSVADRVAELNSATGVPYKFKIEAYFESSDPIEHEGSTHRSLAHGRIKGKEFFRVSLDDAIRTAQAITGNAPLGDTRPDALAKLFPFCRPARWP